VACLAGLLLRLFRLNQQSFWNDEILTIDNAGGTLLDTLVGLSDPNILPLYYLTVRGLIHTQPAEPWLRLPSVLFGVLSIPLFYAVVRHRGGSGLALTAAALLALSPLHIWYSQEARPYALLLLLSLVALFALQLALDRPTPGRKTAAAVAAASVFYCHTIGLGFILFLAVHVLLATPRQRWIGWAPVGLATALLLFMLWPPAPVEQRPVDLAALDETAIGARLDMLEHYDVVERLDLLEELDVIRELDIVPVRDGG